MAARQIAYRLKSEGKAEVVRDAQEVGQALKDSYDKGLQGADAATAAADRVERKYKAMAAAAQSSAAAQASQSRYNAILGVDAGTANSARDSAAFFQEMADSEERAARMARELKAQLDPLGAAQDRLNDELKVYDDLARRGQISTQDLAQAQAQAKARFDDTAAAIGRQEKGLTKMAMAGRLNLFRQAGDVFTTASMGMSPAMIAIQQGPQILEALSQSGIKASRSMLLVGGALGAAAAAAGVAALAWNDGDKAAKVYDRTVTGLGRTAGLTAAQMEALTEASAKTGEVSVSAARDQMAAYLSTGKIGGEIAAGLVANGKDIASFLGVDATKAVQDLAGAMQDPLKAGRDWTAMFGLLSQAQLRDIEQMMKRGDLLAAQRILFDELSGAAKGHAANLGEVESAWDAIARAAQNAWTWAGKALQVTKQERLDFLIRERRETEEYMAGGRGLTRGQQRVYDERGREAWALQAELTGAEQRRKKEADEAKANQNAELERQRWAAGQSDRDRAAREAEAAARRRQAEAERAAREALQRSRRDEDRLSSRDVEIARLSNDFDAVRKLEQEAALRARIRELVDGGMAAEAARTKAVEEQAPLLEARTQAAQREVNHLGRASELEILRAGGEERFAEAAERRAEFEERVLAYRQQGLEQLTAENLVTQELKDLDEARARSAERLATNRVREFQITLARARGDQSALRDLDKADWVDRRAREIEAAGRNGKKLNFGEGDEQAARDYAELMRAETTGAFRDGLGNLIDDIRSGGLKDALSEQLSRAGDRLIDKLLDGFLKIDFSGGKGSGAGNWLTKGMDFLFGKNADGTEYWKGGPTWVGERGPELLNIPRGAQIVEHQRSLRMVGEAERTREASPAPVIYSPSYTISGVDTQRLEQILARDRAEFAGRVVGVVADAQQRRVFG